MRPFQAILLLSLIAAALNCVQRRTEASGPSHDYGRPVNDPSPYSWAQVDRNDFIKYYAAKRPPFTEDRAYPADHPAVQRLQLWLDKLVETLTAKYPNALGEAPRPQILLAHAATPNASVMPLPIATPFTLQGAVNGKVPFQELDVWQGTLTTTEKFCIEDRRPGLDVAKRVSWALAKLEDCRGDINGKTLTLAGTCASQATKGHGFCISTPGNWIFVHDTLLNVLSEEQTVGFLAHELAHYYMSHSLTDRSRYNFFYPLGSHNPASRPTPAPNSKDLSEKVNTFLAYMRLSQIVMGNQKYHVGMFKILEDLAPTMNSRCVSGSCRKACSELGERIHNVAEAFPDIFNSLDTYLNYEEAIGPCAKHFRIGIKKGEIKIAELEAATLANYPQSFAAPLLQSVANGTDLESALRQMNANVSTRIYQMQANPDELFEEILAKNYGWYTPEQEADDLAAEWLNSMGLDPKHFIEALFAVLEYRRPPASEYSAAECRTLYEKNWQMDGGKRLLRSSDYETLHHSTCFRIFNITREIKVHNYDTNPKMRPSIPGPSWETIRKSLWAS